jgi:hypothetical protein
MVTVPAHRPHRARWWMIFPRTCTCGFTLVDGRCPVARQQQPGAWS